MESRLRGLIWVNDVAISGATMSVNYDIHAVDAALGSSAERPIAAAGGSRNLPPKSGRRWPRRLLGHLRPIRRRTSITTSARLCPTRFKAISRAAFTD